APSWPLRAEVFATLLGTLASTGLRISEALALRFGDLTCEGLVIRKTKFNKSRLVPLHPTASSALKRYLAIRQRVNTPSDYIFVSPTGNKLPYTTVRNTFLRLVRKTGIGLSSKQPSPYIHSFRHTFAVSVLETSPAGGSALGWHVRALSTYLGHTKLSHTCWYLQATPRLMRGIADTCQQFIEG